MLEDDLREMFGARVRTPPSALDPAGVAISRGRRGARGRRFAVITAACVAFGAMLIGSAGIKGMWTKPKDLANVLTYDGLFGRDVSQPDRGEAALRIVDVPIDVYVGNNLWTADGRKFSLTGVSQVVEVIRVPAGWLYSDDFRLRLLTVGGKSVQIKENLSSWAVSADGGQVATVASADTLQIVTPDGDLVHETSVPEKTSAVGFAGDHVILQNQESGYGHWQGEAVSKQAWNTRLLAVFGSGTQEAIGLVEEKGEVCLVDVVPTSLGWRLGDSLGCGEVLREAGRNRIDGAEVALSPDGRWLAVPTRAGGVHIIDVNAARSLGDPVELPLCESKPDAPAIWADDKTLLTVSKAEGIVACGTDGSRGVVPLPAGVSTDWVLVPRYGLA